MSAIIILSSFIFCLAHIYSDVTFENHNTNDSKGKRLFNDLQAQFRNISNENTIFSTSVDNVTHVNGTCQTVDIFKEILIKGNKIKKTEFGSSYVKKKPSSPGIKNKVPADCYVPNNKCELDWNKNINSEKSVEFNRYVYTSTARNNLYGFFLNQTLAEQTKNDYSILSKNDFRFSCSMLNQSVWESCYGLCGEIRCNTGTLGSTYSCECDNLCWAYGDCCSDYYSVCLNMDIYHSYSDILNKELSRLTSYWQLDRYYQGLQLAIHSTCEFHKDAGYFMQMVSKCSKENEVQLKFDVQMRNLKRLFHGYTKDEVIEKCMLKTTTSDEQVVGLISRTFIFFKNIFCALCNGFPADDLSLFIVRKNQGRNLVSPFSYNTIIPLVNQPRLCISPTSTLPQVNLNQANETDVDKYNTRLLCERYQYVFQDNVTGYFHKNRHCLYAANLNASIQIFHKLSFDKKHFTYETNESVCFLSKGHFVNMFNGVTFRSLLDILPATTNEPQSPVHSYNHLCGHRQIFIAFYGECFNLYCPAGMSFVENGCRSEDASKSKRKRKSVNENYSNKLSDFLLITGPTKTLFTIKIAFSHVTKLDIPNEVTTDSNVIENNFLDRIKTIERLITRKISIKDFKTSVDSIPLDISKTKFRLFYEIRSALIEKFLKMNESFEKLWYFVNSDCFIGLQQNLPHFSLHPVNVRESNASNKDHSDPFQCCQRFATHLTYYNISLENKVTDDNLNACVAYVFHIENISNFEVLVNTVEGLIPDLLVYSRNLSFSVNSLTMSNFNEGFIRTEKDEFHSMKNVCPLGRRMHQKEIQVDLDQSEFYVTNFDLNISEYIWFHLNFSLEKLRIEKAIVYWCDINIRISRCPSSPYFKLNQSEFLVAGEKLMFVNKSDQWVQFDEWKLKFENNTNINLQDLKNQAQHSANVVVLDPGWFEVVEDEAFVCWNFADVLLDNSKTTTISELEELVTLVTSLVSISALVVVLVVYSLVSELRNLPGKIVMSLSSTLLVAQVLFLCSDLPKGLACEIYAAIHHGAWLASFSWLAAMSVHLALTLYNRFSTIIETLSKYTFVALCVLCWGLPFSSAAISFCLDWTGYANMGYGIKGICWIGNTKALIINFAIPVFCLLAVTWSCSVAIVITIRKSFRFRNASVHRHHGRQVLLCINLSLLLGSSWILYFLALAVDTTSLWIIHNITNGSEGLYIFLSYVMRKRLFISLTKKWSITRHTREQT